MLILNVAIPSNARRFSSFSNCACNKSSIRNSSLLIIAALLPLAEGRGEGMAEEESSSEKTPTSFEASTMWTSLKTFGESWLIPSKIPRFSFGLYHRRMTHLEYTDRLQCICTSQTWTFCPTSLPTFDGNTVLIGKSASSCCNVSVRTDKQRRTHPFCRLAILESMN